MTRKTSPRDDLVAGRARFQSALLAWFRQNARTLPWRDSPSLYKTVVSEFMLQQTQVKTVLPYFARWLAALPDFAALAAADEAQVLRLWEGLGYYSRARNLHRLARALVKLETPPRTAAEWRELPGVGPYTAAAITSIVFGAPAACVDGNVVRILARLTGDDTAFRDSATAAKAFASLAEAILPGAAELRIADCGLRISNPAVRELPDPNPQSTIRNPQSLPPSPGEHNEAMMELGATVCFRQNPLCLTCPVREFCAAARDGNPEAYPRLAPKEMERRAVTRVWCERDGALLLHRAAADARRFASMHELPTAAHAGFAEAHAARGELLAKKRRGITRFQITESIHLTPAPRRKLATGLVWIPLAKLEGITLSGPHRRWVNEILTKRRPSISVS
jgi:A/G-specific adenine glycosylase